MSKTIFIVEDDADISRNLRELLESEGFDVDSAPDGRAALQKLQANPQAPSLILLDLMMPVLDGFGFRQQQELDLKLARIPVVIMTADGQIEAKKLKVGARAYVRKPIDIEQLLDTIHQHAE